MLDYRCKFSIASILLASIFMFASEASAIPIKYTAKVDSLELGADPGGISAYREELDFGKIAILGDFVDGNDPDFPDRNHDMTIKSSEMDNMLIFELMISKDQLGLNRDGDEDLADNFIELEVRGLNWGDNKGAISNLQTPGRSDAIFSSILDRDSDGFNDSFRVRWGPTPFKENGKNKDQIFTVKVNVKQVPEPLTILGAATALGFGALFKKKLSKTQ